jgi:hypothetical protein
VTFMAGGPGLGPKTPNCGLYMRCLKLFVATGRLLGSGGPNGGLNEKEKGRMVASEIF